MRMALRAMLVDFYLFSDLDMAFFVLWWYFVLLQEVKDVNELLKALYDNF